MHLQRIDIYGFKSFGQEVHVDLPPGITAFVGPNGGGKSNVVDAIRWALGEQKVRELRAERWDELLFSGGSARPAARLAEVNLTFDNHDGEMTEWPEVLTVSRRYYRNGQSEYLINGRSCRLKDVTDLFLDSGLGRFNYAVISQGKVEMALLQKPADRLEQLEEAAGVSRYKVRRKESLSHLAEAQAQLVRVEDLCQEAERQMSEIEQQAQKEKRYLEFEARRQNLQSQTNLTLYLEAMDRIGQLTAARQDASNEQTALRQALQETEGILSEKNLAQSQNTEELARTQDALESARDEVMKWQLDRERLEAEASGLKRELEQIEAQVALLQKQMADVAMAPDGSPPGNQDLTQLRQQEQLLSEKVGQLRQQLLTGQQEMRQWQEERSQVETRRQQYERHMARLEGAFSLKHGDDVFEALALRREQAVELERVVKELTQELVRLTDQRQKLRDFVQKSARELQDLRHQYSQRQARLRVLHQLEAEGEGLPAGVKAVLAAQQRGELDGILGTLGNLVESDSELVLAVQTALGGSSQDVVVVSENEAREAVQYLKTHAKGRATFLPLDTIRMPHISDADRRLAREAGVLGWAIDLVRYPRQAKAAVMHVLGRVLVTRSLDDAVRMGQVHRFRYRTVSLDGQVVHAGGAITGGSRNPRDSRATRKIEIETLVGRLEEDGKIVRGKEDLLESSQEELEGIEQELDAVRELLSDRRNKWTTLRTDLEHGHQWGDPSQEQVAYLQDISRLEHLTELINQREEDLVEMSRILEERQATMSQMSSQRAQIESHYREVQAVLGHKQQELARIESQLAQYRGRQEHIGQRQLAIAQEQSQIREEIDQLEHARAEIDAKIQSLKHSLNQSQSEMVQLQRRVKALEFDDRKLTGLIAEVDQEMMRLGTRWEDYQQPDGIVPLSSEELTQATQEMEQIHKELAQVGPVVPGSLALYQQLDERYQYLNAEREDVRRAELTLRETLAEIDEEVSRRVTETAAMVEKAFQEACQSLYGGGDGGFSWIDGQSDIGIELWVKPPGKRTANLTLLSGGEKALGGIAWLFALLAVRPSPFVVLDEVEASLDEANAARFAKFIMEHRGTTQYVIVTHHKVTMESADALWGVAGDGKGLSRLVSVILERDQVPAEL